MGTMIYLKDEATGVCVEDCDDYRGGVVVGKSGWTSPSWFTDDQAESLLRGLLRWKLEEEIAETKPLSAALEVARCEKCNSLHSKGPCYELTEPPENPLEKLGIRAPGFQVTIELNPITPEFAEQLGRLVRKEWVEWAREQPEPKPHWLLPWEELSEPEREVDRRIGKRLAFKGAATLVDQHVDVGLELKAVNEQLLDVQQDCIRLRAENASLLERVDELHGVVNRGTNRIGRLTAENSRQAETIAKLRDEIEDWATRLEVAGGADWLVGELREALKESE